LDQSKQEDIMVKKSIIALMLVGLAVLVHSGPSEEVVVKNMKDIKDLDVKQITWGKDGAKMVLIPAQSFNKEIFDQIRSLVPSEIFETSGAVYMDCTEVTVGQFKKFLQSTDYKFDGDLWGKISKYSPTDRHPMIYVTWNDAVAYAKWTGKRLTTEVEWEYAARGGLINKEYSWGNDKNIARDNANYKGTSGKDKWKYASPVGSFQANGYGLYDMVGNVSEWCDDWYGDTRTSRVLRGGFWAFSIFGLSLADRYHKDPDDSYYYCGFRCVVDMQ